MAKIRGDQTTNEDKLTTNEVSSWKENNNLDSGSSLGIMAKIPPKVPQTQVQNKVIKNGLGASEAHGTRNGTAPGISKKLLKMTLS